MRNTLEKRQRDASVCSSSSRISAELDQEESETSEQRVRLNNVRLTKTSLKSLNKSEVSKISWHM